MNPWGFLYISPIDSAMLQHVWALLAQGAWRNWVEGNAFPIPGLGTGDWRLDGVSLLQDDYTERKDPSNWNPKEEEGKKKNKQEKYIYLSIYTQL